MGQPHSLEATLEGILEMSRFPKVQLERAFGPVLHRFMGALVQKILNVPSAVVLAPEFPLEVSSRSLQSFNIDWMLYVPDEERLVMVELKTSAGSYNELQLQQYKEQQKKIRNTGALGMQKFIERVSRSSNACGKYAHLNRQLEPGDWKNARQCTLMYLAPGKAMDSFWDGTPVDGDRRWVSFSELPQSLDVDGLQADWAVVHQYLQHLSVSAPSAPNGGELGGRNYRGIVSYDDMVNRAEAAPDAVVVGYTGGLNALKSDVAERRDYVLHRRYKYDDSAVVESLRTQAAKTWRNWITGREFLAAVHADPALAVRGREVEALRQAMQQAGEAWLSAHRGTVALANGPVSLSLIFSPDGPCEGAVQLAYMDVQEDEEP